MKTAVYPGTFDPFTTAHLDVLTRACAMFDFVHVGILINTKKTHIFSPEERMRFIKLSGEALGLTNFDVQAHNGMLVDFVTNNRAHIIVRGLRNTGDFESESAMFDLNHRLNPGLDTVYLFAKPENRAISSSAVREIGICGGNIAGLVHDIVLSEVEEGLKKL